MVAWIEKNLMVQKSKRTGGRIPMRLNPIQRRLAYECPAARLEKDTTCVVKPRQVGSSTFWLCWCLALMVMNPGINILWVNVDEDSAKEIREKFYIIWDSARRQVGSGMPEVVKDNEGELKLENGSRIRFYYSGEQEGKAANIGRGGTFQFVVFCEFAYWVKAAETLRSLKPALEHSDPSIVVDSTANGVTGTGAHYYKYVQKCLDGTRGWTLAFYAWYEDPRYTVRLTESEAQDVWDSLTDDEIALIADAERNGYRLTAGQLAWRREKLDDPDTGDTFDEIYPDTVHKAFIKPGECAFDRKLMRRLNLRFANREFPEPIHPLEFLALEQRVIKTSDGPRNLIRPRGDILERTCWNQTNSRAGYLRVWRKPEPGERYFAGIDGSEGFRDWQVMVVLDSQLQICALLRCKLSSTLFAAYAQRVLTVFGAWVLIEKLGSGVTIRNRLIEPVHEDVCVKYGTGNILQVPYGRFIGERDVGFFKTNQSTRPMLLDHLYDCFNHEVTEVVDPDLFLEMGDFRDDGTGKVEHAPGSHDDILFATALAIEARRRGTGMSRAVTMPSNRRIRRFDDRYSYMDGRSDAAVQKQAREFVASRQESESKRGNAAAQPEGAVIARKLREKTRSRGWARGVSSLRGRRGR